MIRNSGNRQNERTFLTEPAVDNNKGEARRASPSQREIPLAAPEQQLHKGVHKYRISILAKALNYFRTRKIQRTDRHPVSAAEAETQLLHARKCLLRTNNALLKQLKKHPLNTKHSSLGALTNEFNQNAEKLANLRSEMLNLDGKLQNVQKQIDIKTQPLREASLQLESARQLHFKPGEYTGNAECFRYLRERAYERAEQEREPKLQRALAKEKDARKELEEDSYYPLLMKQAEELQNQKSALHHQMHTLEGQLPLSTRMERLLIMRNRLINQITSLEHAYMG